jgi:superfamily II DNA/RNA helicase
MFTNSPRPIRGGGHSRFQGGRRGPSRNKGFSQYIDTSKFINKAIITEEAEVFEPEHKFSDFVVSDIIKRNIADKGYEKPTPIQDKAIPHILAKQDIVGIANTGTGKTGAFLIPLINKAILDHNEQILIVVPTRELALQIEDECRGFGKGTGLYSICCVGGSPIGAQLRGLRHKNNFIIGTPGRLKDLAERGAIRFSDFRTIVLDEADRMLDMGFIHDMRYVMGQMPKERHTLFFSATMSSEIEKLISEFLRSPIRISVKTGDTSKNIEQDVVRVHPGKNKMDVLRDLLSQKDFSRVLIFSRTKHGAERLSKELIEAGFKAASIHGNKTQSNRQRALSNFRNQAVQVLVATDVAARGLDIDDVSHVINYDIPATYDDYVHRIGRTGRGNKRGKALTFIN